LTHFYHLNKAKALLENTDLSVSEIARQVGFKDLAHFSKSFQEAFGMPPSATNK
jgi:AraC-like DNA-binding protein